MAYVRCVRASNTSISHSDIFIIFFQKTRSIFFSNKRTTLNKHNTPNTLSRERRYEQAGRRAFHFGYGLVKLGMVPLPKNEGEKKDGVNYEETTDPHTILIYEDTSADWMCAFAGAMSQSLVVATSYATLGVDAIISAVKECNVKIIVCNRKDVKKLLDVRDKIPTVTCLIYTNLNVEPQVAVRPWECITEDNYVIPEDIEVRPFQSVVDLGGCNDFKTNPPTRNNMAVIMYTSGSTGKPKGVMIRHKNLIASAAMFLNWGKEHVKEGQETYLAYLPAAHIFELIVEFVMISYVVFSTVESEKRENIKAYHSVSQSLTHSRNQNFRSRTL